ncbi:hypothetical protein pb186bvf_004785 [Paramecium bursaria]
MKQYKKLQKNQNCQKKSINDLLLKNFRTHTSASVDNFFLQTCTTIPATPKETNILDKWIQEDGFDKYKYGSKDVRLHTLRSSKSQNLLQMQKNTQATVSSMTIKSANSRYRIRNYFSKATTEVNNLISDRELIFQDVEPAQEIIKKEVNLDQIEIVQGDLGPVEPLLKIDPVQVKAIYDEMMNVERILVKQALETDLFMNQIKQNENDFLNVRDNKLNGIELKYLIDQLKLKQQCIENKEQFTSINFDAMEASIKKLGFFERFTKSTRINLLKLGVYLEIQPGEYVFKQGDYGDNLFVILQGSVSVKIERQFLRDGLVMEQVVSSLYDGQHFGELAMMDTNQGEEEDEMVLEEKLSNIQISSLREAQKELFKQDMESLGKQSRIQMNQTIQEYQKRNININNWLKEDEKKQYVMELTNQDNIKSNIEYKRVVKKNLRKASIQASERCHLLAISRDNFKNILMVLMQDELEQKIKMLRSLRFFKHLQPFVLIPLANQLIAQLFHLDEVVIKEGEPLEYMYILHKGSCNVIRTCNTRRLKIPTNLSKGAIRKTPPIACGQTEYLKYDRMFETKDEYLHAIPENGDIIFKIPDFAYLGDEDQYIKYRKSYVYKRLYPKDIIFGRVLTGLTLEKTQGLDTARMTIVSSSSQTIMYKISQKLLQFCPEFLIQHLVQQLLTINEIDELPKQSLNKQIKEMHGEIKLSEDQIMIQVDQQRRKAEMKEFYAKNKFRKPQDEKKQDTRNHNWELYKNNLVIDALKYK